MRTIRTLHIGATAVLACSVLACSSGCDCSGGCSRKTDGEPPRAREASGADSDGLATNNDTASSELGDELDTADATAESSDPDAEFETLDDGSPPWPASIRRGRARIDLRHLSLPKDLHPAEHLDPRPGERATRGFEPGALPEELQRFDPLEVVTREGLRTLEIARFTTETRGPWFQRHYYLETESSDELKGFGRRSVWTFAAPPGTLSDGATKREGLGYGPADQPPRELLDAIVTAAAGDTTDSDVHRALRKLSEVDIADIDTGTASRSELSGDDFGSVEMELPGRASHVAFVRSSASFGLATDDLPEGFPEASGLYAVSRTGELVHAPLPTTYEAEPRAISPLAALDLDGDGEEGLFVAVKRPDRFRVYWIAFAEESSVLEPVFEMAFDRPNARAFEAEGSASDRSDPPWIVPLRSSGAVDMDLARFGWPGWFDEAGLFPPVGGVVDISIPYRARALPTRWHRLRGLDILHAPGVRSVDLAAFRAQREGADQTWGRYVRSTRAADLSELEVDWAFAAPRGDLPTDATYRTVESGPLRGIPYDRVLDAVVDLLEKGEDPGALPEDLRDLESGRDGGTSVPSADSIRTVEADFPDPHETFVFFHWEPGPRSDRGVAPLRAAFLFGADGRRTATITDPRRAAYRAGIEPLAAADPDGDGREGLLYRAQSASSHSDVWLDFAGSTPKTRSVERVDYE